MSLATATRAADGDDFYAAADARKSITDALSTLPELVVSSTAPTTPSPLCAWPKWAVTNYVGGHLRRIAEHEYDVLVLLPNGFEPSTTEEGDALLSRVVAALWHVGVIKTAQPAQVVFDNAQAMPALQIRVAPNP